MTDILTGRVLKSTGSWYSVATENGETYECRLKGKFRTEGIRATNPISVGDMVDFENDLTKGNGIITKIHSRHNYIIRKATKLTSATHIIASNIDQVIIIASLIEPRTTTGFIDRMLATAEAYHIPSAIIINKCDLYNDELNKRVDELDSVYSKIGYQLLRTSIVTPTGISEFRALLENKISLISGHSGVGKSALINSVDNTLNLKTGDISAYNKKGTHTTTFANMFALKFGGYVIDTPGIKEFGLVEFEKKELGQRFPEIRKNMQYCRFNNCLHINEPGCYVKEEVKKKVIADFRYKNYLKILETIN